MNKKSSNNTKKPLLIILLLIVIILGGMFMLKPNNASKIERENLEFISSLPQLQGKDLNKLACFDFSDDPSNSYVDCFIPNEFNSYVNGIEDLDKLKTKLTSAYLIEGIDEDVNLSEFDNFFNSIQPSIDGNENENYLPTKQKIEDNIKNNSYTNLDLEEYTYIQSLEGNYSEAKTYRERLCKEFPKKCKTEINLTIKGEIVDGEGKPLEGAVVSVLGTDNSGKTNENGIFEFNTTTYNHEKIRVNAVKEGYSNGVIPMTIMSNNKNQEKNLKITLEKSQKYVKINTINNTVDGEGGSVEGNNYIITTEWSKYQIPFGAIIHRNGEEYKGELNAYLFEFNKSSNNADLLNNDIFDDVAGYAGNLMKTFGMPYILFVSKDGEVLHVLKSNPMILQNKIQEMQALKTNQDHIYSELDDNDLNFLVEKSNELGGYPVDRFFLVKYNILRFPAFWVFDQTKGVWVNEGVKVIKNDGTVELKFYTLSSL